MMMQPAQQRRRRARVVTLQISIRTLLQMIVFAVVLYKNCTWRRLFALSAVAVGVCIFRSWVPLRQFISSLLVPAPPRHLPAHPHFFQAAAAAAAPPQQQPPVDDAAGVPPAPPAAQGEQPFAAPAPAAAEAEQAAAAAPPPAAPVPAAPAPVRQLRPQRQQQGGLLHEIRTVVVGLVTSLIPGYGAHAEEAALIHAVQDMLAREAAVAAARQQRRARNEQQEGDRQE